jgi:hypothetical protein
MGLALEGNLFLKLYISEPALGRMRSYEEENSTSQSCGVIEETSASWRAVVDYPPFNIVDATIFESL